MNAVQLTSDLGGWLERIGFKEKIWLIFFSILAITISAIIAYFLARNPINVGLLLVTGLCLASAVFITKYQLVILTLLTPIFISGQMSFWFGFSRAFWMPYAMLGLLTLRLTWYWSIEPSKNKNFKTLWHKPLILLYFFFAVLIFTWLANGSNLGAMILLIKNYVLPWALTLYLASCIIKEKEIIRIFYFVMYLAIIQVPLVIIQHFYMQGKNGTSWDVVVGTFGGNYLRGGTSAAMAVFLFFAFFLAIELYKAKVISLKLSLAVVFSALISLALAEVKIVFGLLPLGFIILNFRDIVARPSRFLTIGLGVTLASIVLLYVYAAGYAADEARDEVSFSRYMDYTFSAESKIDFYNPLTKEVSRMGALNRWSQYHAEQFSLDYLVGAGAGSSRESDTLGSGNLTKKYDFTLSTSTASVLLWESGVLGLIFFTLFFLTIAYKGFRCIRGKASAELFAIVRVSSLFVLIMVPLFIYNRDAVDSQSIQIIIALCAGVILYFTFNSSEKDV